MNTSLGTLTFALAAIHPELLADPVAAAIAQYSEKESIGVAEIDPTLSDTAAFCAKYNITQGQAANCIIVEAKRGETITYAACIVLATTRADVNGVVRKTLDARKVSFAPMETAVSKSRMEYGAITPIGLPSDWPILVDSAVAVSEYVIIGSGIRKSKIAIPGKVLAQLPNVQVIEGLGRIV